MKTKEELRKQIETEYSWHMASHRHLPNVAYVKVKWNDEEDMDYHLQTIVLDENEYFDENGNVHCPYIDDDDVLYYVSGINELLDLIEDNNCSDFVLGEFIGFEYLK